MLVVWLKGEMWRLMCLYSRIDVRSQFDHSWRSRVQGICYAECGPNRSFSELESEILNSCPATFDGQGVGGLGPLSYALRVGAGA